MHAKAAIKSNGKDGLKVKYFISGILGFLVMFYRIISNSSFLIRMEA